MSLLQTCGLMCYRLGIEAVYTIVGRYQKRAPKGLRVRSTWPTGRNFRLRA